MEHCRHNAFVYKDLLEITVKVQEKDMMETERLDLVFLATLCSPSSCNGGVCRATQNNIVCICSTGKFGDRCQVIGVS